MSTRLPLGTGPPACRCGRKGTSMHGRGILLKQDDQRPDVVTARLGSRDAPLSLVPSETLPDACAALCHELASALPLLEIIWAGYSACWKSAIAVASHCPRKSSKRRAPRSLGSARSSISFAGCWLLTRKHRNRALQRPVRSGRAARALIWTGTNRWGRSPIANAEGGAA